MYRCINKKVMLSYLEIDNNRWLDKGKKKKNVGFIIYFLVNECNIASGSGSGSVFTCQLDPSSIDPDPQHCTGF